MRPVETAIGILTAAGLTVAGMRRKVGRLHHYKYRCLVTTDEPVTDATSTAT